jgi:hypothetical protein
MAKRSYRVLIGISGNWLGAYLKIFSKPGVFLKICRLWVNCGKRQGPK